MKNLLLSLAILFSCTWYGKAHHGKTMANGEPFDMHRHTAATYLYPLGTTLEVTYQDRTVIVLVTDRCDNKTDIDLSRSAFMCLTDLHYGRITVSVCEPGSR